MPNIEALYINSPVPPCDCRRKYTGTTPLLCTFLLQKYMQEEV